MAGSSCCRSESDFTLARYNHDGTLDSSFGIEGMVTTDLDSYYEAIASIAILGDGKIVAVGRSGYDLAVEADGKIVAAGTWTIGCLGRAPDQTHNPLLRLCRSRRPAVVPLRLQTPGPGPLRSSGRWTSFTVGDVVCAIWSRGHEPAAQSHPQPVWIL